RDFRLQDAWRGAGAVPAGSGRSTRRSWRACPARRTGLTPGDKPPRRRTMTYVEGFVIAVPTANKQKFIDHARLGDAAFIDHGAARVLECWQDNVEKGHTTDFFGAVDRKDDEAVVFSWI